MFAFPSTTSKLVNPAEFAFATTTVATAVCALLGSLVVHVVSACADVDAMTMPQDDGDYENKIALSMLVAHEEDDEEQYDVETKAVKSDTTIGEVSVIKSTQAVVVAESECEDEEVDFENEDDDEMFTCHHCTTLDSDDEGSEFDTITDSSSASSYSDSDYDYDDDVDEEQDPASSSSSDLEVDEKRHTPGEDRDTTVATATAATESKDLRAAALRAENRELSCRLRQVQSKALKYIDSPEYQLTRAANLARRAKLPVNPKLRFKC